MIDHITDDFDEKLVVDFSQSVEEYSLEISS